MKLINTIKIYCIVFLLSFQLGNSQTKYCFFMWVNYSKVENDAYYSGIYKYTDYTDKDKLICSDLKKFKNKVGSSFREYTQLKYFEDFDDNDFNSYKDASDFKLSLQEGNPYRDFKKKYWFPYGSNKIYENCDEQEEKKIGFGDVIDEILKNVK